jgi:hypothetical protein
MENVTPVLVASIYSFRDPFLELPATFVLFPHQVRDIPIGQLFSTFTRDDIEARAIIIYCSLKDWAIGHCCNAIWA